jgi:membrane protease subunit HflK
LTELPINPAIKPYVKKYGVYSTQFRQSVVKRLIYQRRAAFRKLQRYLQRFWTVDRKSPAFFSRNTLLSILIHLIVGWALSGFFILRAPIEAIVTRWGNYQRTIKPGIHWHMRFVEKVFKFQADKPRQQVYTLSALTADAKLISVAVAVECSIHDGRVFLFGVCNAERYFPGTVVSVLQQIVSRYSLPDLLSVETNSTIRNEIQKSLKTELSRYPLGINLLGVSPPVLKAPVELTKDFNTLQKAQETAKRIESEANNQAAQHQHQTALAIQALYEKATTQQYQTVTKAKIETGRFLALLPYYEKNPQITIQHLHAEKVEKILKDRTKVMLVQPKGSPNSNALSIQLPLDQSLNNGVKILKNEIQNNA